MFIKGMPDNLPMKNDENIWGQMQRMVMRDGRVFNMDSVLEKIRDMKMSEKQPESASD